ncbi:MAG: hypothetical protein WA160_06910 [Pseudobdellovibrio sp.]
MKKSVIILMLLVSSCSKESLFEKQETLPAEVKVNENEKKESISQDQIKVKIVGIPDQPNKYQVQFTWPEYDGYVRIFDGQKVLNENQTEGTSFVIDDIDGGSVLNLIVEVYGKTIKSRETSNIKLNIPKDLVLSGEIYIQDNTIKSASRIFIAENTVIYNQQFNLEYDFDELHVASGVVFQNFPTGAKASDSIDGRSGGYVKLIGKLGVGKVQFVSNSEIGGNGINPPPRCQMSRSDDPQIEKVIDCFGGSGRSSGHRGSFSVSLETNGGLEITSQILDVIGGGFGAASNITRKYCDINNFNPPECLTPGVNGSAATGGQICSKLSSSDQTVCYEK